MSVFPLTWGPALRTCPPSLVLLVFTFQASHLQTRWMETASSVYPPSVGLTCRDPARSPCLTANRYPTCDKDVCGPRVSSLALCYSAPDLPGPVCHPRLLNRRQALQDETSTGRKCVDSWCRRVRLPCLGMPWLSSAKNMGRPWCLQRREAYVL